MNKNEQKLLKALASIKLKTDSLLYSLNDTKERLPEGTPLGISAGLSVNIKDVEEISKNATSAVMYHLAYGDDK